MDDFHTPGESHQDELWLVSYADMLTLLIGFFVLIVAAVPLRKAVFERIAASISGAKAAPLQNLRQSVDDLVARTPALRDRVVARARAEGLGLECKETSTIGGSPTGGSSSVWSDHADPAASGRCFDPSRARPARSRGPGEERGRGPAPDALSRAVRDPLDHCARRG